MKYKAHDYQEFATDFILEHPVGCLILDMGLGKTVITLTALQCLLFDSFEVGRILIIAPKRVAENTWPMEIAKWEHLAGLQFSVVMGNAKQRREALARKADLYIIGRDNVTWLVEQSLFSFDMIVIDELSSFKSPKAQRFKALKKVRPMVKRALGLQERREIRWIYGLRSESLIWGSDLEGISADTGNASLCRTRGTGRSFIPINRGKARKKKYMN